MNSNNCIAFVGYYWTSPHLGSGPYVWNYRICHDGIRLDHIKVLVVSFLHVLHFLIFHLLWYDDPSHCPQRTCCCHIVQCILCNMEPFLRLRYSLVCELQPCLYLLFKCFFFWWILLVKCCYRTMSHKFRLALFSFCEFHSIIIFSQIWSHYFNFAISQINEDGNSQN